MTKRSLQLVAGGLVGGGALFLAGAFGATRSDRPASVPPAAVASAIAGGEPRLPAGASLDDLIASLQTRLAAVPTDHTGWATLGLAYVQQARITVDPTFYPKAEGALARSLAIDASDNFLALAGQSALASARHAFADARELAIRGLEINPYSPLLYGALGDAELQLGNYDAAFTAIQHMVDLSPDTASLSRASYTWELRGEIARATTLMERALADAPTGADRAFALVQLGGLAFDQGDAAGALERYNEALDVHPADVAALAGKARAEAALGQVETALDHYAELVARAPEPGYLLEYGRLLESLGRDDEAAAQYAVFEATSRLFAANGVEPDAAATLFDADRGNIDRALAEADAGLATRPFVTMHDARAWALHGAGRDHEAQAAIDQALALGTRNAGFHFHAGMIALALGDTATARAQLTEALAINPFFDPLSAPIARTALASIEATP